MRIPLSWLAEMTELPESPGDLVERLNAAGLECHMAGGAIVPEGVVTGRIVSCRKHPDADRLVVCAVDVGEHAEREIVCGAPNVREGFVGAVALPGVRLGDIEVGERTVRGVRSRGMLCSERELGISDDHDGILLLPGTTPVGRPLGELLKGNAAIETYPFANRGDLMSVRGTAREIAALEGRRFEAPQADVPLAVGDAGWSVEIEDSSDCPRYAARIVEGLVPGPSPDWLAGRLSAAGIRPLLNLVDVTNYVLLELGHPLHAFDREKLAGRRVGVRRARSAEALVTLDGVRRDLQPGVLVITDGDQPVATGGVMGGESTMVSETTRAIFLEGASFSASAIRAGSRALRLTTDASQRFERGVDPQGVPGALDRAVELLLEMCPGARLAGAVDTFPSPGLPRRIRLRERTLRRILGVELPSERVQSLLESLGNRVEADGQAWNVDAPSFRGDLLEEEDLVEEVARVHGYDRLPERAVAATVGAEVEAPRLDRARVARTALLGLGLTELVTPSLVSGGEESALIAQDDFFRRPVPLRNPLSEDRDCLRGSLVPSLLRVLETNRAHSTNDLAVFEVGRTFGESSEHGVEERLRAALLLSGRGLGASQNNACDFFDMKGLVEVYVERFWNAVPQWEQRAPAPMDPVRSAAVVVEGRTIGYVGEPSPSARTKADLPAGFPVVLAEIDLETQPVAGGDQRFSPLPRHPAVTRDLAFVVEKRVRHAELTAAVNGSAGELLEKVELFDLYEGAPLEDTEKSLAYALSFRSPERSLTHEEVDEVVKRIIRHVGQDLGARIR